MRVIKPSTLVKWGRARRHRHPCASAPLHWLETTTLADWQSLADVRRDFPNADLVKVGSLRPVIVFNIGGNHIRLIAAIPLGFGRLYPLDSLTEADYFQLAWERRL